MGFQSQLIRISELFDFKLSTLELGKSIIDYKLKKTLYSPPDLIQVIGDTPQVKSLKNLQRLMPTLILELE